MCVYFQYFGILRYVLDLGIVAHDFNTDIVSGNFDNSSNQAWKTLKWEYVRRIIGLISESRKPTLSNYIGHPCQNRASKSDFPQPEDE